MPLLLAFAFLGGVVTILSPCILPILPIVFSGSVGDGKKKPYGIITGFVLSFTFFTLFLSTIVQSVGISAQILRTVSVVVLAVFGVVLLVPIIQVYVERLFTRIAQLAPTAQPRTGFFGGVVIGISLGLLWTPCVGPILASVISLALTGAVTGGALLITIAYALGTAVPLLVIMYGGRQILQKTPWLIRRAELIQQIFGLIMVLTAVGIYFNVDRDFQSYVLQQFPQYGIGLTRFEDADFIHDALDELESNSSTESVVERDVDGIMAPELIPGGEWLNSEPLTLAELKGSVVVLDFMTYSCINCIRTFPYLNEWYEKYSDDGLVIIGVHTPEFEFEKDPGNVQQALVDFGIVFPVMQDNNYATWRAYQNRYWPRKYILNYKGEIVYDHIGEGAYDETEAVIRDLLIEKNTALGLDQIITDQVGSVQPWVSRARSPETYFGSARNEYLGNGKPFTRGIATFSEPSDVKPNTLYLVGTWNITDEYAESVSVDARVIYQYDAQQVFFVAGSETIHGVDVQVDGEYLRQLQVYHEQLYRVVNTSDPETGVLELRISDPGLRIFTFTFG